MANGWAYIDTAPKDGHSILLFHPEWTFRVRQGGWDAHESAWRVYGYGCVAAQPTMWHPLPPDPAKDQEFWVLVEERPHPHRSEQVETTCTAYRNYLDARAAGLRSVREGTIDTYSVHECEWGP